MQSVGLVGAAEFPTKVVVPAQRQILDAIASLAGSEPQGAVIEVEEVLMPERSFVQLDQDQFSKNRDFADGLALLFTSLGKEGKRCHEDGA